MSLALAMMVRNEAAIIGRALDSALAHGITHWSVVDTGSTDETREIVRAKLGHLPGALHDRLWVNFGHNRSETLALAREQGAEWLLLFDADETLAGTLPPPEVLAENDRITCDGVNPAGTRYLRTVAVRASMPFRYEGVTHEYMACDETVRRRHWSLIEIHEHNDSHRRESGQKAIGDYELLRAELERPTPEPTPLSGVALVVVVVVGWLRRVVEWARALVELAQAWAANMYARTLLQLEAPARSPRTVFYLARSCVDLGRYAEALDLFRERVNMGGEFKEEIFQAALYAAQCIDALGRNPMGEYLSSWQGRPWRIEGLMYLAAWFQDRDMCDLARMVVREAADAPYPHGEVLFVDGQCYGWRAQAEYAACLAMTDRPSDALVEVDRVLRDPSVPPAERATLLENRQRLIERVETERASVERTDG